MIPPLLLTAGTVICACKLYVMSPVSTRTSYTYVTAGIAWRHFLVHGVHFCGKKGSVSSLTRDLYVRLVGMVLLEAIFSAAVLERYDSTCTNLLSSTYLLVLPYYCQTRMAPKSSTSVKERLVDEEEVLQAVVLADSFNKRFAPLTRHKPRASRTSGSFTRPDLLITTTSVCCASVMHPFSTGL